MFSPDRLARDAPEGVQVCLVRRDASGPNSVDAPVAKLPALTASEPATRERRRWRKARARRYAG